MVYSSIEQLIGKTPLLELINIENHLNLKSKIYAKLESFNPGGSAKDRVALKMIENAEKNGLLTPNSVIIEPTSGNTGIGLAAVAAAKGYRLIIVMPENMSIERRTLIKAYGAELVLTKATDGMQGAINEAQRLSSEISNSFIAGQFENSANPQVHYETTGPEIYADLDGNIDIFVAGVGTGGTITGVGKYLKSKNSNIKIVAVEPAGSPVLSTGKVGSHGLQGIGAGFIPAVLDKAVIDDIITVTEEDAYQASRLIGRREGFLVGISSGAAAHAAITLAKKKENGNKNIIVMFPDLGDRYLSTKLFKI